MELLHVNVGLFISYKAAHLESFLESSSSTHGLEIPFTSAQTPLFVVSSNVESLKRALLMSLMREA